MIRSLLIFFVLVVTAGIAVGVYMKSGYKKDKHESSSSLFLDSLTRAEKVDSMIRRTYYNALFDTVGLYTAPVIVTSSKIVRDEYSAFRKIRLSYKNVSGKTVSGVRFRWYGVDAFNDPADMGGAVNGFGSGQMDDNMRA